MQNFGCMGSFFRGLDSIQEWNVVLKSVLSCLLPFRK